MSFYFSFVPIADVHQHSAELVLWAESRLSGFFTIRRQRAISNSIIVVGIVYSNRIFKVNYSLEISTFYLDEAQ